MTPEEYEWQDEQMQDMADQVKAEAAHYVRMYGQDGDCIGHVWEEGSKPPRLPDPGQ